MLVNKDNLSRLFTGLNTIFNNAFSASSGNWQQTGMMVPSSSAIEDYGWLSRFPAMRKWQGDKYIKALKAGVYTVRNEDWESTIVVKRSDIEDDALGIYNVQAQMAGFSAAELPDTISDQLKNDAFASVCLDGQYFYDTDHPVGRGVVSNKITPQLSAENPTAALASYGLARKTIMSFRDDEGQPLRLVPDVLEVPPALESVANTLMTTDKLEDNAPNPWRGTATVRVNPGLTNEKAWFLHVTNQPVKPFIFQQRKAPVFVSQVDMSADNVFMRGEYLYGTEARASGAYGFWQLSVGSDGTVDTTDSGG